MYIDYFYFFFFENRTLLIETTIDYSVVQWIEFIGI